MRRIRLALAALLFGTAAIILGPAPAAHAAWCVTTARDPAPDVHNLSVADGQWNDIRTKGYGGTTEWLITEGSYRHNYCVGHVYVALGKDIKMRCGNGYWQVYKAGGWHSLGGLNSWCRLDGGSVAISFEVRPNGYWG